ncbi:hypothetical protein [Dyadobacter chenhuakuii]|uniref:VWFA domain-containing protein n=1 Tax=Dyadobacter chenhuakuii TaxID=2909339 RepID=A0ABY4XMB4_9BACT|nr:hypothetical protein [Dyadobacter chenhuakuii]MCF2494271.1 hypothetical protein [Dyadobacter chenhuakuii]USJ31396.1 hypothetical protein NFI80_01380 [Dyadobacter chenhuakuii]
MNSTDNSKQWSSAHPGYIIFLVDQSGSMSEKYAEGKTKAEFTASVINRTISELVNTNMDGDKIKDRVFISLIGYGGNGGNSVDDLRSDYLSSFGDNPIKIEKGKQKQPDGNGGFIEVNVEIPIFLEPKSPRNGRTPMGDAFSFAKQLIDGWITKKPENPAPIIINISDGMPYNGIPNEEKVKSIRVAKEIMEIITNDGNPLLFNVHLGNGSPKHEFTNNDSQLDEQAAFLFNVSSLVPNSFKTSAQQYDFVLDDNSRGFVSNADPITMTKFIQFGSMSGNDLKTN